MIEAVVNRIKLANAVTRLFLVVALLIASAPFLTPYMTVAGMSYLLMVTGFGLRKSDPKMHALLMSLGMLGDLTLVGVLEFQRNAIKTAMSFSLTPFQQLHILFSSVATALYIPMFILGLLMLFKPEFTKKIRKSHKVMGITAFVFRSAGFFLMFSMLGKVNP